MHCLAEHAPKFIKNEFPKPCWLILRDLREEAKIISKLHFLTRRHVLRKNQTALLNTEKQRKSQTFDSGCTAWQSTPQYPVWTNLPNFVGRILGGIREEAKIDFKISYLIRRWVLSKSQRALSKKEKFRNCL